MINLKEELRELVAGNYETIILRHMRDKKCSCWRRESNTPDLQCPNCKGSGYLFRESLKKVRMFLITIARVAHEQDFEYGKSYSNMMTAYFPIEEDAMHIAIDDIIYELRADAMGNLNRPLTRRRKWLVTEVFLPRTDGSVAQFVKILAKPLNA